MVLQKLGKYEILTEIGRGAMGVVYKALDPILEREVALKTMMASMGGMDSESKARFYREARSAAKLTHRNIVTIFDMGEEQGVPFIAMEYLDGVDLHRKMKRDGPLPLLEGLKIAGQVLHGLHYAHQFQIVHRDIKPANIYILKNGTAKILDFGIAKLASSEMTRTGMVLGTVDYMSPEQIRAEKTVDGRSDLFSAGVILYELLVGRKPFPGETITQVMFKIVHDPPGEMPTERELPPRLVEASRRALEKDPARRFQTGEEFATELEAILREMDAELSTVRQMAPAALDIRTRVTNARRLFEGGSFEDSAAMLREVLEKEPGHKDATELLTLVDRRMGMSEQTLSLEGEEGASAPSGSKPSSIEQILAEIEEERKTSPPQPGRSDSEAANLTVRLEDSGAQVARPPAPAATAPPPAPSKPQRARAATLPPTIQTPSPSPPPQPPPSAGPPATLRAPSPTAARAGPGRAERAAAASAPAEVRVPARRLSPAVIAAAAAAVVIGVVVAVMMLRGGGTSSVQPGGSATPSPAPATAASPSPAPTSPPPQPAAAAASGYLAVDAEPWAEVIRVREAGTGKEMSLPREAARGPTTPVVLDLPAGRYDIVLKHPDYPEVTVRDLGVTAGQWTRVHETMPGFSFRSKIPAAAP